MAYNNLKKRNNAVSGLGKVLVAPYSVQTTLAANATVTNPGDTLRVGTAPVFATNKGFLDLGLEVDLNKLDADIKGEFGSIAPAVKVEVQINDISAEQMETILALQGEELSVILKQPELAASGKPNLWLGRADCGARITEVKFSTGQVKGGGKKGGMLSIEYFGAIKEQTFSTIVMDSTTAV